MGIQKPIQLRNDVTLEEFYALQDKINTEGLIIDGEHIRQVEYYAGEVWFMAGGTIEHGDICDNLYFASRNALKGKNCKPHTDSKTLAIDELSIILYPDLFITCGDLEKSNFAKNGITNAIVIIEVLSSSTGNYDRGGKFRKYKQIPSFKEYILINQDKPLIETFVKHEKNLWSINYYEGLESDLHIQSVDVKISLADIYEGINFEETEK